MGNWIAFAGIAGTLLGVLISAAVSLVSKWLELKHADSKWERETYESSRAQVLADCELALSFFQSEINVLAHGQDPEFEQPSEKTIALGQAMTRLRLAAPQPLVEVLAQVQNYRFHVRSLHVEGPPPEEMVSGFAKAVEVFVQCARVYFARLEPNAREKALERINEYISDREAHAEQLAQQSKPNPTEPPTNPTHPTPAE